MTPPDLLVGSARDRQLVAPRRSFDTVLNCGRQFDRLQHSQVELKMRLSLGFFTVLASIALVDAFTLPAIRLNRQQGLRSEATPLPGDLQPHPPDTPPPSELLEEEDSQLLEEEDSQLFFLSDSSGEDDVKEDLETSDMPPAVEKETPPAPALEPIVSEETQKELAKAGKEAQEGLAVATETIVDQLIVSEHSRICSKLSMETHTRDITETSPKPRI